MVLSVCSRHKYLQLQVIIVFLWGKKTRRRVEHGVISLALKKDFESNHSLKLSPMGRYVTFGKAKGISHREQ